MRYADIVDYCIEEMLKVYLNAKTEKEKEEVVLFIIGKYMESSMMLKISEDLMDEEVPFKSFIEAYQNYAKDKMQKFDKLSKELLSAK